MYAPLPIGLEDPIARFRAIHEAMRGLKESGQAVGADVLTSLADFAPPTILSQAARLQTRQRFFNLTVTNVPGPQFTLYLMGRPLRRLYPLVPLVENAALGIAIMSYDGRIDFGLLADYDALPDLDDVAAALDGAIAELAAVAGAPTPDGAGSRRTRAKQHA
jgi:diacylglycerol O-acyltransferase